MTDLLLPSRRSKRISLFLFMVLICHLASAQSGQDLSALMPPAVIPPSPDPASLGRYGNIPVGLHTGIPDISIPLYTVTSGQLQLPISVSYHAAGNKVNEVASWVGYGFSLNAGGVVSRSVVGKSDENGFWNTGAQSVSQINASPNFSYLKLRADGADTESDFYFYNFNGHSGKFVYTQAGDVYKIPETPIDITHDAVSFQITDETGTVYKFGEIETTSDVNTSYKSSFYLTEIVSADGIDHIYLSYVSDATLTENSVDYTMTVGSRCTGPGGPQIPNEQVYATVPSSRWYSPKRLNEITYPNGKVQFVRDMTRSDASVSRLDQVKVYYKDAAGSFILSKSFVFGEDYFVCAASPATTSDYRLKLTGITEKDENSSVVRKHSFYYNESAMLPPLRSKAQDWWGFYNGQTTNGTLLGDDPSFGYNGYAYPINGADRTPDATAMKLGILNKIVYPTGGYTEFDYEPHYYGGGIVNTPQSVNASAGVMGDVTNLQQQTVPFTPATSGWVTVNTLCSDINYGTNPFFSTVKVLSPNGIPVDHMYDPYTYPPYLAPTLSKSFSFYATAGVTYQLKVMSKGSSDATNFGGAAFASATATWIETTTSTSSMAGGLRVKETRDYESPTATPVKKIYKYGIAENGYGVLLVPADAFANLKQQINTEFTVTGGLGCYVVCTASKMIVSARPLYDLSSLNGAPVVYPEVTVYDESATGPNGKTIVKFDVQVDEFLGAPAAYNNGRYQMNNSWRGGDEVSSTTYNAATNKISEKFTTQGVFNQTETIGTKVGYKVSFDGCGPNYLYSDPVTLSLYFYYFDYPIHSGVKKIRQVREVQYSSTDALKSTETQLTYTYNNFGENHQQLSKKVTLDSEGNTITSLFWYPADFTTYNTLVTTKNVLSTPVKEEIHKNDKIIAGRVTTLNADGKPTEVYSYETSTPQTPPVHSGSTPVPTGYLKKLDITYDGTTKRIAKASLVNDVATSYLWSYNDKYPIAKVVNAEASQIAATSFEAAGKGNWTYTGATYQNIPVKTGTSYYRFGTGLNITRTLTLGKYRLEYWSKGTAVTLAAGSATITAIRTSSADANGWILYEKEVNVTTASVTLTLSGAASAHIDELRVYPVTAQITTYTYHIENGLTSVNDPANAIVYYEYDSFGRLKWMKDLNGDIVKANQYHYKGN